MIAFNGKNFTFNLHAFTHHSFFVGLGVALAAGLCLLPLEKVFWQGSRASRCVVSLVAFTLNMF